MVYTNRLTDWSNLVEELKSEIKRVPDRLSRLEAKGGKEERMAEIKNRELPEMERKLKNFTSSVKLLRDNYKLIESADIVELKLKQNTHEMGIKGFKNAISDKDMKKAFDIKKVNQRTFITKERGIGHDKLVSLKDWLKFTGNKTMVNSSINERAPESIQRLNTQVQFIWNNVFSDEEREGLDILRIRWSEQVKRGYSRTMGDMGGRGFIDRDDGERSIIMPSELTMYLHPEDDINDVANTIMHELAHNRLNVMEKDNPENFQKYVDHIIGDGREKALTPYVEQKWDELEEIMAKDYDRPKAKENDIKKAQHSVASETHSEYFGMINAPSFREYHSIDKDKLEAISKKLKEYFYD